MRIFAALIMAAGLSVAPAHADNIADCEVVLMEALEGGAAQLASFRDASDFIASVYDEERETLTEIDGYLIRGLMCTRANPLPTQRDFPLIASRVPFVLSSDFDSPDASVVHVMADASGRAVALMAEGLSDTQKKVLAATLKAFNAVNVVEMDDDDGKAPTQDDVNADELIQDDSEDEDATGDDGE